ncbi:TadE/TadG family type IV pilus assembly protein [Burkholderia ambifaria]|uniref:TadE/TadG family type IV pilus assembly protein n=1 Tax=Burkholderia ambifaria TaxID=152480 RepID=UPI00158E8139|nr:TadE/TadG family type IV pilus assembly protein [Burkholderia ambifaria]MBR8346349.1 pilus assembly protein [Burkholderia ambifaria]
MNQRHWKTQRGVAVVEFALVLPLLLLILFGIIEFGLLMFDQAVITNASREGARAGIVLKTPKASVSDIQSVVLNYCQSHLISLGGTSSPTVTVPSGQGGTFGTPLTVTVTYQFAGLALGSLISPLSRLLTLTATTVMNNE